MRFALVNHIKTEAEKDIKGVCPNCGAELIPKCGDFKVHHWAHKGNKNCDPWQELKTKWHTDWQDNYPIEWQEVSAIDETKGEKHIADVRTPNNLVIEFQHSHIDPEERTIRENFYKNMVWVVDGTRLKYDYPRFFKSIKNFQHTDKKGILKVDNPENVFPLNWLNSSVPVVFDFKGLQTFEDEDDYRNKLYCLFPKRIRHSIVIVEFTPTAFIKSTIEGDWSTRIQNLITEYIIPKNEQLNKLVEQHMQQEIPNNITEQIKQLEILIQKRKESQWILHKGKMIKRRRF